ncbi:MAG: serine/threonine protein kinase [Chloroflexota bacterium]|jgi:serine/threonine protein kinase
MSTRNDILCPGCRRINPRRSDTCLFCGHELAFVDGDMRYFLIRVIKTGGQAVIFEAIDDSANRSYAIKEIVLPQDQERAGEAFQRCALEARLLATLSHPGIPRFYTCLIERGRVYIVMDLVRGIDLEDLVRQRGTLSERMVLSIASQVCDVLQYLHTQETPVIFRDVKPSNIMYDSNGLVSMIDFGIARLTSSQSGHIMGTPGYAPPEQYRGDVSPASDIYALGATMHHLLSGRDPRGQKPFDFPPLKQLTPHVSEQTAAIVHHALQIAPHERFFNVLEMRTAIRTILRGEETDNLGIRPTSPMSIPVISPPTIAHTQPSGVTNQLVADEFSTRNITPTEDSTVATHELAFTFTIPVPTVDPEPSTEITPVPATPLATPWRSLLFVSLTLLTALIVWAYAAGWMSRDTQQPTSQQITVVLEVVVKESDQGTIDAVFRDAYQAHISQTYGTQWAIDGELKFVGTPPEAIAQQNGQTTYRGRVTATITTLP